KDAGLTLDWDEIARKGKISAEEVQIAKWYGIYSSRQEGNHMARVVVPGGQITAKQARALADIAENYAQGNLNLTTRQSIQMHWLKLPMLPDFLRDLSKFGLSTFHGCGDVNRNVAACPWASTCEHRRIDVLPFAKETSRVFADSRDLDNLPRKFKITYSGCGASCAQPYMNDVGAIAVVRKKADGTDERGFKVVMGGGMGWRAFVAQEVYSFVPPSKIVAVTRAIGLLFRDHGDRFDRAQARLKFVVKRYGIDKCRELLEGILDDEGVDRSDLEYEPFADTGPEWPSRPLTEPEPVGTDGLRMQRIMIPKGELNHHQLRRIADLAEMYGDKHVYTNNRQNLEIHGVDPAKIDELQSELVKLGLALEGFFGLQDIVPCVGTTYCPLAVTKTRSLYDLLQSVVHQEKYAEIRDKVLINITGCPNSCSPYRITDIGFRGMRIREADRGSSESYEMRLGGTQESHGKVIGNFKLHDCVLVTAKVLDVFLEEREGDESLAQNAQRKGVLKYKRAVQGMQIKYETAPTLLENSLIQGHGKTDLDRKVLAKDIPCQNACPAHTNVPQYI
ncbi:nitrite/sulfite reductase, partial [bacterium]|nr:nitrite/sulfite reductase [bacterium]